jgi:hypothetical protein
MPGERHPELRWKVSNSHLLFIFRALQEVFIYEKLNSSAAGDFTSDRSRLA